MANTQAFFLIQQRAAIIVFFSKINRTDVLLWIFRELFLLSLFFENTCTGTYV